MRLFFAALITFVSAAATADAGLTLPKVAVGDRYVYQQTQFNTAAPPTLNQAEFKFGWKSRAGKAIILIADAPKKGGREKDPYQPVYKVYGEVAQDDCLIDITEARSIADGRGCQMPFEAGEQWDAFEFIMGQHIPVRYTYIGNEQVSVPAGTFKTLKFQFERNLGEHAVSEPGNSVPRRETGFVWYAPFARAKVRSESWYYEPDGKRVEASLEELISFQLKSAMLPSIEFDSGAFRAGQ